MMKKGLSILGIPIYKGQKIKGPELAPSLLKNVFFKQNKFNTLEFKSKDLLTNLKYAKNHISSNQYNLFIGGDHSISLATISGSIKKHNKKNMIVWIDAHTDCNNFITSPSNNLHGMSVTGLLGKLNRKYKLFHCIDPSQILYIGIRSVDSGEKKFIKQNKIKMITMDMIKRKGLHKNLEEYKSFLKNKNIHISFDVDSVDPKLISSTGTPVKDGLNDKQIEELFKFLFRYNVNTMDIVELNPKLGDINKSLDSLKIIKKILSNHNSFNR